jgi:Protein of unknown function (DUF1194)
MLHRERAGWWLATVMVIAMSLHLEEAAAAEDMPVDLELVLAVDISLSMDEDEQRLQRDGYVAAFRNPEIIEAIKTGPHGRIVVTYVEWSGESSQRIVIPWTLIDTAETVLPFAAKLATAPINTNYRTSISEALIFATGLFDDNGYQGRQAIDVSGDGANNQGVAVEVARHAAVQRGITINGMPLLLKPGSLDSFFEIAKLDDYYQDCVIGGTGAFMIPVRNVSEFVPAIRRKLILEIARRDLPILQIAETSPRGRTDCLIGEKMWNQWMERFSHE